MCLTLGLGVANVFAGAQKSGNKRINEVLANNQTHLQTTTIITAKDAEANAGKDSIGGNLSAVFQYYGGALIACHGADGTYTLYDSYGQRGVIKATGEDGVWALQSWQIRTSDLDDIKAAGSLEKYLLNVGYESSQLSIMSMNEKGQLFDENGNLVTMQNDGNYEGLVGRKSADELAKGSESLYQKLIDELEQGVNISAVISLGSGSTGPQLTIYENGQPQITWTTDPQNGGITWSAMYYYDEKGFSVGVLEKNFEITSSDNTADGTAQMVQTYTFTRTTYNSNGIKTDTTYKIGGGAEEALTDPVSYVETHSISKATEDTDLNIKTMAESSDCYITSVTHYSANNSIYFKEDLTTGKKIYYADNQQSYAVNAEGTTVEVWEYSENGKLMLHVNYEGKDEKGEKVGTTEIYDEYGRFRGTLVSGTSASENAYLGKRDAYRDALKALKDSAKTGKRTMENIQSVQVYAEDLLNSNAPKINGYVQYSSLTDSKYFNQDVMKGFGYNTNDVINMLRFANGVNPVATTQIADGNWDAEEFKKLNNVDSSNVTEERTTSIESGRFETYETIDGATGYTCTNTILLGGAQAYQTKHYVADTINITVHKDPVVNGTYQGIENINGKTYAKVSASEVNIMDGNGFQAAAGETILVEIDEETEKSLKNMKKGESIMFMGDVTKDVNGYMTMKINTNYSGGFATGSQINKLREDIQNEKLDWVKENTAVNTSIFGNNGVTVDWKAGWNVLTGKNKAEDLKKKLNEDGGVYLAF